MRRSTAALALTAEPGRDWWLWQQSDSGTVPGINGPVDINVMNDSR